MNTYWMVQYLKTYHPDFDLEAAIAHITSSSPCLVENLQTGRLEEVTLSHLQESRYWFSHRFVKTFLDRIQEAIPDPKLGFKMGSTLYRTQPMIKTAVGIPLLGVRHVASRVSKESAKYNRTKEYRIMKQEPGLTVVRITHNPDIDTNNFTMEWNAGCLASYAKLTGATDITVDPKCVDPGTEHGGSVWDFAVRYKQPPLLIRIAKAILFHIPWIREITERAEAVEADHAQQIIDRDRIIEERTTHLLGLQQKLIDEERNTIEQQLHKMSLELTETEERERKAIAEDLHDSVTQLLALSLANVRKLNSRINNEPELEEVKNHLEHALNDLRSLTFQISPPVLYDFGLEAALEWLVEDVNRQHGMNMLFSNLLEQPLSPDDQQKVTLYRAVRELIINIIKHSNAKDGQVLLRADENRLVIEVSDEGDGFAIESIQFGFGLHSLRDRMNMLNGSMDIISSPGEGAIFLLSTPLSQTAITPCERCGVSPN